MAKHTGKQTIQNWFEQQNWDVFEFQQNTWDAIEKGENGLLTAPTGSGKTYALLGGILAQALEEKEEPGLKLIWITPIRALAKEIELSAMRMISGLGLNWRVGIRSGDTATAERNKQTKHMPDVLITTPESLQLLLAQKGYEKRFSNLRCIVCDEWHELVGTKRGVQMELAMALLKEHAHRLLIWGISATIGNMDDSLGVLLGGTYQSGNWTFIESGLKKEIELETILPDQVEQFPWSGHLGVKLLKKVVPIINQSNSTLIFTNTRAQCEIWYQKLLEEAPELAGQLAMHHGSIAKDIRDWVEDALHKKELKAVVCTSSLDLGVDFRPVERIIQIGSPKGVARFIQRAGRSGHKPGVKSKIYFVPTHSLELLEGAALRDAIALNYVEDRPPYLRSFDTLVQFLVTVAVSSGFYPNEILSVVRNTHCFESISDSEWQWCLNFITTGGDSLNGYDEYHKVQIETDGKYKVNSRKVAMRHRLQIGTIVSDAALKVKFVSGGFIGTIEEWFIAKLKPGASFWFAGRCLELVRIREMVVQVRSSKSKTAMVPSWQGGRMPLSSNLAHVLRKSLHNAIKNNLDVPELKAIQPLLLFQSERSHLPLENEFLIETFETKEGYHCCMYPFEGRFVHEGIASLVAYRMSLLRSISFSISFSDYGFELVSDQPIPIGDFIDNNLFSTENLMDDIQNSVNASEMSRRRFRDIAGISGLIFKGFPGKQKADRHLQSSAQLFFNVFRDYEPDNLLYKQAYDEALEFQMEFVRLRSALVRISGQDVCLMEIEKPSPFAFPIMVDRIREKFISESLEAQVKKMKLAYA